MSNKIVPQIYRTVIDDVIRSIKPEFDEYGVTEDVLAELQHKWESKVIASHVADFDNSTPQQSYPYGSHVVGMLPPHYATGNPYAMQPPSTLVKSEPIDNRYMLNGPPPMNSYSLPPLPGPGAQMNGGKASAQVLQPPGQQSVLSFSSGVHSSARPPAPSHSRQFAATPTDVKLTPKAQPQRIPQLDGPSSSYSDSPSPPHHYTPHTLNPTAPQTSQASTSTAVDDITSDLDDSSTEDAEETEGMAGENDIVFCTYDKVARVKNKWKCVLKDGMIHINGRDYLFAKCTGEFEW